MSNSTKVLKQLEDWEKSIVYAYTPNHWGVLSKARIQQAQQEKMQLQAAIRNLEVCARINASVN